MFLSELPLKIGSVHLNFGSEVKSVVKKRVSPVLARSTCKCSHSRLWTVLILLRVPRSDFSLSRRRGHLTVHVDGSGPPQLSVDVTSSSVVPCRCFCHVCVSQILDAMNQDSRVPLTQLQVDGGMTSNRLLMQLQADILCMTVGKNAHAGPWQEGKSSCSIRLSGVKQAL